MGKGVSARVLIGFWQVDFLGISVGLSLGVGGIDYDLD